jgi:hypothetical protein
MRRRREELSIRPDHTAAYRHPAIPGEVRLKFAERPDGRLVVADFSMSVPPEEGGVSSWHLHQLPVARLEAAANSPTTRETLRRKIAVTARFGVPRSKLKLVIPEGRKYDDRFYRRVADAFAALDLQSRRPVQELADINDVPVSTISRWIREARARGFLGPGQRQKKTRIRKEQRR